MAVGNPATGYYMDRSSNCGYVKDLFVRFTSGASGAVATLLPFGEVVSVTLSGTSTYTVQFSQSFNGSRNFTGNVAQASYSKTGACGVVRIPASTDAANGVLTFMTVDAAGDATAATTGDIIEVCFQVATATGYP